MLHVQHYPDLSSYNSLLDYFHAKHPNTFAEPGLETATSDINVLWDRLSVYYLLSKSIHPSCLTVFPAAKEQLQEAVHRLVVALHRQQG